MTHLESLVELGLSSTFSTILTQCSKEIFMVRECCYKKLTSSLLLLFNVLKLNFRLVQVCISYHVCLSFLAILKIKKDMHLSLIIYKFDIFIRIYLHKFISSPKSQCFYQNDSGVAKSLSYLMHIFPAEVKQGSRHSACSIVPKQVSFL